MKGGKSTEIRDVRKKKSISFFFVDLQIQFLVTDVNPISILNMHIHCEFIVTNSKIALDLVRRRY